MLVLIPIMNENNWYKNVLCPFFPFHSEKILMIYLVFSHSFYWLKTDRSVNVVLNCIKIFLTGFEMPRKHKLQADIQ